jgi:hypothetical protein
MRIANLLYIILKRKSKSRNESKAVVKLIELHVFRAFKQKKAFTVFFFFWMCNSLCIYHYIS